MSDNELKDACRILRRILIEIVAHNNSYHHVTPQDAIYGLIWVTEQLEKEHNERAE